MELGDRIYELFLREYNLFPKGEIQDYYKLLYQSVFGAEHMVESYDKCLDSIYREMSTLEEKDVEPIYYDIGLDTPVVRINLSKCKAEGIPAELIARAFFYGAQKYRNKYSTNFELVVRMLVDTLAKKPFKKEEEKLAEFYTGIERLKFPAIHHSVTYLKLYNPHYRVIPLDIWEKAIVKFKS